MAAEKEEIGVGSRRQRLSCTTCFDALWFCYTPVHQMQRYYRLGELDNCKQHWASLYNCLVLKTKPTSHVEEILEKREKEKPQMWELRTPEEAKAHWQALFGHLEEGE